MSSKLKTIPLRTTAVLALGAIVAVVAALALRAMPAQAQGVMAAPACQCSAPTTITGMSAWRMRQSGWQY
jgi:hypothetical protein